MQQVKLRIKFFLKKIIYLCNFLLFWQQNNFFISSIVYWKKIVIRKYLQTLQ